MVSSAATKTPLSSKNPAKQAKPDKYEAILSAALSLFVSRGYHGTAVPQVARKAGVAAGTIYHYFKGKEALVNALFRKWKSAIAQGVFTEFPQGGTPREQFSAIWQQMATFALENQDAFSFLEHHHHGSYLDEESLALESKLKDFGAGYVVAAQKKGVLKTLPPKLLMELIFGAFNGVIRAHWDGKVELTPELIHAAEEACWDAIALS